MRDILTDAGLACALAQDEPEAQRSVETQRPALTVVPVCELERWVPLLHRISGGHTSVPVLGMVSRDAPVDLTRILAFGVVSDLLAYPCAPHDVVQRVTTSMRGTRATRGEHAEHISTISTIASLRSATEAAEAAILRAETAAVRVQHPDERAHLAATREAVANSLQAILGTLIGNAEAAVPGRVGHAQRVTALARALAQALNWPHARVEGIALAGFFLDIGLLAVPPDLLCVPGPLEEGARELLHAHPDISVEVLEPLSRIGLPIAAVRAHHERLDGSGYPRGLRGRQVPLGAQILAVADTYAALTRHRPHRRALTRAEAFAVLEREAAAGRLSGRLVTLLRTAVEEGADGPAPRPTTRGPRPYSSPSPALRRRRNPDSLVLPLRPAPALRPGVQPS